MNLLASLSFGAPWILAALAVLPAIWWLLRVTPPLPRRVVFPPLRLLLGLKDREETPARTPLWLLLLRLAAAAAAILALAEPIIGETRPVTGSGPIVFFVDNGWTAAHRWEDRRALMSEVLRSAAHDGRSVAIIATADAPNTNLLDAGAALRGLDALQPEPWLADRLGAARALAKARFAAAPQILWLSDGIEDGHAREVAALLARKGALRIFADVEGNGPLVLLPPGNEANGFSVTAQRSIHAGDHTIRIAALGAHGELLAAAPAHFADGQNKAVAKIFLPLEMRNETERLVIENEDSAGAVQLLGSNAARRRVGLVSASNIENEQPLLSDLFYLERALSPYSDVDKETVSDLLARNVSVLVLADIARVADADHDRVARFVAGGGLLIRFAGARMTNGTDDLMPVKLRTGERYLGGAMAWAAPQHLAPFPETGPFGGLAVPDDVTVSRQILAEPSVELSERSWARLADGTPLVTAAPRDKGWIVLFHVTAGPAWSSLPLSGLYVDMLRRLLMLSAGAAPSGMAANASLPPLETLDGFARVHNPPAEALPLRAADIAKTSPSRLHPPGLYGAEGAAFAFNAAGADTTLLPLGGLGQSIEVYASAHAIALEPPLLVLAMLLLLFDAAISLALRGFVRPRRWLAGTLAIVFALLLRPGGTHADDAFDLKAALDTRLAYVVTGVVDVDAMSKAGLFGLGLELKNRTSYEPEEPMGVNLDKDDLSFFPLLYWPMDPREKNLSPVALAKIADYMRNGGTIFFDTRDLTLGAVRGAASPGEQTLRRLTAGLDLPPLQSMPPDHVLTKAFYLLREFPGRWDGGKVWVEALPPQDPEAGPAPARGGDGVSPVIIGGNDWAAAWAVDPQGRYLADVSPGGDRQRELAMRFGVNVVMYALTGNYKTDQVHAPALLERLGH